MINELWEEIRVGRRYELGGDVLWTRVTRHERLEKSRRNPERDGVTNWVRHPAD
jgi:hypothetical protein